MATEYLDYDGFKYVLEKFKKLIPDVSDYITNSDLSDTLKNYAKSSDISGLVSSSELSSTLSNYVTSSSLSTTLASYTKSSDLSDYVKFTDYATTSKAGVMSTVDKTYIDLLNSYIVETNPGGDYKIPLDYLTKFFGEFLNDNVAFTSDPKAIGELDGENHYGNAEAFQLWDFDGGTVLFGGAGILMNYANAEHAGILKADDYAYIQWIEDYCVAEIDDQKRGVPLKTLSKFFNELYNNNAGLWNGDVNNQGDNAMGEGKTIAMHIRDFDGEVDLFPSIMVSLASQTNGGMMSATDKQALDRISVLQTYDNICVTTGNLRHTPDEEEFSGTYDYVYFRYGICTDVFGNTSYIPRFVPVTIVDDTHYAHLNWVGTDALKYNTAFGNAAFARMDKIFMGDDGNYYVFNPESNVHVTQINV